MSRTQKAMGAEEFLLHRKNQEIAHNHAVANNNDPMMSLVSVEFNTTELCNRKCPFCPRVDPDIYPNQNLHMHPDIVGKVAGELASMGLLSRISFSGFGEPLLHRDFCGLIRTARKSLPKNTIEVNTNGDPLIKKPQIIRELFAAGLTLLYVNCYDGPEQVPAFQEMFEENGVDKANYRIRKHWVEEGVSGDDIFGLVLNNRSGTLQAKDIGIVPIAEPLQKRCFYPFYKMLVDWNGDVLFCSNDWGREVVVGNVRSQTVRELWLSDVMSNVRQRLANADRSVSPCSACDIEGTLHGKTSFDLLQGYYAGEGA